MEEDRVTSSREPPKTDLQLQQPEEVGVGDDNKSKVDDDAVDVESVKPKEEGQKKKRKRPSLPSTSATATTTSGKRKRGRPRGSSGNDQQPALPPLSGELAETAGGNFAPYEITVNAGENVVSTISAYSRRCRKAVCVLSANGAVSSVLIRRPDSSSSDTSKFEGHFEIVSLSGSYTFFGGGDGSRKRKKGKLTVLLVEPNGRVFGGAVEGSLIAAGPIQLVLASFKQDINKQKTARRKSAGSSAAAAPSNSSTDSEMVPLEEEAPSMIEGQPSFPSPTSGLLPTTTTGVSDNVNIPANQNMTPASVDASVGQTLRPITAQRDSQDDDASVKISGGQPEK